MRKLIATSFLAVLALAMLLPVASQINAPSANHSTPIQEGPMPPPPGVKG